MSTAAIQSLLNANLAAFAKAQSPALAVAYENKDFAPPQSAPYLRAHLLLSTPVAAALGSSAQDYQRGVFQVDVLALPDKGWGGAYPLADSIRTAFKRGTRLTGAGAYAGTEVVCESVAVGPAMNEDTRYKLPVSITFYAYMNPA
jgi:hypothetical protein